MACLPEPMALPLMFTARSRLLHEFSCSPDQLTLLAATCFCHLVILITTWILISMYWTEPNWNCSVVTSAMREICLFVRPVVRKLPETGKTQSPELSGVRVLLRRLAVTWPTMETFLQPWPGVLPVLMLECRRPRIVRHPIQPVELCNYPLFWPPFMESTKVITIPLSGSPQRNETAIISCWNAPKME